jgi:hypothetical protein
MSEPDRAKMKIWNVAAKVADVDAEIKFVQELGGTLILDEILSVEGQTVRVALMKWADKYLHLFANAVYELQLERPLAFGLCHVVMEVSDLDRQRSRALEAGAREVMPPQFISAGFGTRDVAFLQSPGGILFELIRVHEHRVPELP